MAILRMKKQINVPIHLKRYLSTPKMVTTMGWGAGWNFSENYFHHGSGSIFCDKDVLYMQEIIILAGWSSVGVAKEVLPLLHLFGSLLVKA